MSVLSSNLVYVSVFTTGPDENRHEILEVALLAADGSTLLHTAIDPENLHTAVPEVLVQVGFSSGDWAPSPRFGAIARQILGHLTGPVPAGHNTQLAMRFVNRLLRDAFESEELDEEEISERMGRVAPLLVDTVTLAWEQLSGLGLPSLNLDDVCFFLRIPYRPDHSALEDARAAHAVYQKLFRANVFQRWWWKKFAPQR